MSQLKKGPCPPGTPAPETAKMLPAAFTSDHDFDRVCAFYGIVPSFVDIDGQTHVASRETREAILEAMGVLVEGRTDRGLLTEAEEFFLGRPADPVIVMEESSSSLRIPVRLSSVHALPFECELTLEGGLLFNFRVETVHRYGRLEARTREPVDLASFELPDVVPPGYHDLQFRFSGVEVNTRLIVCPTTAHLPDDFKGRTGISLQQYALHDAHDHGIGDAGTVRRLMTSLKGRGISVFGLSPVHALFPGNPLHRSPYSPSARSFFNPSFVHIENLPEYAGCRDVTKFLLSERDAVLEEKKGGFVRYDGAVRRKLKALDILFARFEEDEAGRSTERAKAFEQYLAENPHVRVFAIFEALHEHFADQGHTGFRTWPGSYSRCDHPSVREFAESHPREVRRAAWRQWIMRAEMENLAASAREADACLYLDLAVGADPGGAEVWMDPDLHAWTAAIGAPPDPFAPQGQNWGLAPMIPHRLKELAYEPFVRLLRANMLRGGLLRIDHVMGLFRLYWAADRSGAYVAYPQDDLLGILMLESRRRKCAVIGEDLGTVPPEVRHTLAHRRVLSWKVIYFERDGDVHRRPEKFPADSIATINTHDLPTLSGYWTYRDIELRDELRITLSEEKSREARQERSKALAALWQLLIDEGLAGAGKARPSGYSWNVHEAFHRLLARSSSRLVLLSLHDLLVDSRQPNLPGTVDEYPNWSLRYTASVEEISTHSVVQRLLDAVREERAKHS